VTDVPSDLQELREAIEAVDQEILAQLRRRMELVDRVAAAKLDRAVPLRDRLREEHVFQRVRHAAAEAGLDPHEVERLYRLVMEMSIARQQAHIRSRATAPLRVVYQGVEGSYSHLAAQRHYGRAPERRGGVLLTGHDTLRGAVGAVRDGSADLALLPIENTTAGSINETYDLLAEGGIAVTGEVISRIEHCLLALAGATVEGLTAVISHPQALMQCEAFFRARPWIEPRAEFDTAGSARKVRQGNDRTLGAIASASAARVYGLEVLATGIQSQPGNYTRFFEVAVEPAACPPGAACKTSLLLVLAHRPGALGKVLSELGERGVNLSKLESRPQPGTPWQYRFYLDLEGHAASEPVAEALEAVRALTTELRLLGTYPRAEVEDAPPAAGPAAGST
jgi:chorismate mutase/prephenate dehydratase